jgi:hypothetical protein
MKKMILAFIVSLTIITGCSSDTNDAKKLGFKNPEQMKYFISLGFKNFEDFRKAHPYVVKSDSTKFAESGLGLTADLVGTKNESDHGTTYAGPKGVWMMPDESGKVAMIGYSCIIKNETDASIDNIKCDSNASELHNFKQGSKEYCGYTSYEESTVFIKNNAFIIASNVTGKIEVLGFVISPKHIYYNETVYDTCEIVKAKVNAAKSAEFDSIYEMDEAAKQGIKTGSDWKLEIERKKFKVKYSQANNSLEKATIILVSNRKDFGDFKDNGGLNVINDWLDYKVSSIEAEYRNEVLTLFHLTVDSNYKNKEKPATFNNLKRDLVDECGSQWESRGRSDVYWSDSKFSTCEISQASQGGYHVVVSVKTKKD